MMVSETFPEARNSRGQISRAVYTETVLKKATTHPRRPSRLYKKGWEKIR